MKKLLVVLVLGFIVAGCSYKPKGVLSRVQKGEYSVTNYAGEEAEAVNLAHADAKGVCDDKHGTEFYNVVKEETKDLRKKTGGEGNIGAALNLADNLFGKNNERDFRVKLQFKCTQE